MKIEMQEKRNEMQGMRRRMRQVPVPGLISLSLFLIFTAACSPAAQQVKPDEPVKAVQSKFIESVETGSADDKSFVVIKTTAPVGDKYTVAKVMEPPQVVIEMPDTEPGRVAGTMDVNDGAVTRMDISRMDGMGVRVVISLSYTEEPDIKADGNALTVYFAKAPAKVKEEAEVKAEPPVPAAKPEVEVKEAAPPAEKVEAKVEAPTETLKIIAVKIKKVGRLTRADIITSGDPVAYDTYVLNAPPRVVVDIGNVGEVPAEKEIKVKSPYIKVARLGKLGSQGRVVFDSMEEGIPYDVVKGRDRVVVFFGRKPSAAARTVEKAEAPSEAKAGERKEETKVELPGKTLTISGVKVRQEGKFTKVEIITGDTPAAYNAFTLKAPNRVVVDIENARGISTKKEIKAVSPIIKSVRLGRYGGQVRVVFDFKGEVVPYDVVKGKDRLIIAFGNGSSAAAAGAEKAKTETKEEAKAEVNVEAKQEALPVEEKTEAPKEEVKTEPVVEEKKEDIKAEAKAEAATPVSEVKPEVEAKPQPETKAEVKEMAAKPFVEEAPKEGGAKPYSGQKVTLEFKDADIKNIFRIIAEVSGYNMIIDNAVTGRVTIRLVSVPWDQALDIILDTNNLGMTKVGNVIRIARMADIKKEEEEKLATKQTKAKLEDLAPPRLIPISHAKATDIKTRLEGIKTDRGKIDVDERTNTIIITDVQKSIDDALALVKSLDTPTPQVMIEARIVEANTNFTRDLGVQWGTGYTADANHGNATGYYFPNSYGISAGGGGSYALTPPTTGSVGPTGGAIGISFGSINNTLSLDLRLSALEAQGWGKVISSPKVLTLDNKEASIEQGLEIPYQSVTAQGNPDTKFKSAKLSLKVTPHATADGRLNLKIVVNKDSPSSSVSGAGGAPAINTNVASTEILVKDGETTVIGGIYTTNKGESESYTPFLGKIPLIGWLFKSKSVTDQKSELLIFITPRIAQDKPA